MKFEPTVAMRRLFVWAEFPVKDVALLVFRIAERRNADEQKLHYAMCDLVEAKLPKGAELLQMHHYAAYQFEVGYDVPPARVAYMEKRILIAIRKACKAFWGIHKIGKTPEYRAQWRKENPL